MGPWHCLALLVILWFEHSWDREPCWGTGMWVGRLAAASIASRSGELRNAGLIRAGQGRCVSLRPGFVAIGLLWIEAQAFHDESQGSQGHLAIRDAALGYQRCHMCSGVWLSSPEALLHIFWTLTVTRDRSWGGQTGPMTASQKSSVSTGVGEECSIYRGVSYCFEVSVLDSDVLA